MLEIEQKLKERISLRLSKNRRRWSDKEGY